MPGQREVCMLRGDWVPSTRFDFPELHLARELYVPIKTKISSYSRAGKIKAKPDACVLCGNKCSSYCNSHTIPQFSLNEIAREGKVCTNNRAVGMDLIDMDVGVKRAGTFRSVCRSCDQRYFSDYESPDMLKSGSEPSQTMLGEIAAKVCLLERYKANVQVELLQVAQSEFSLLKDLSNLATVRMQDHKEDDAQLAYAMKSVKGAGDGYKMLFDTLLSYTVPVAFQGQLTLASDFDGTLINDVFNYSESYRTEPLYICIFPLREATRIIVFCRSNGFPRYSRFYRRLKTMKYGHALNTLLKLIVAYSEELYISPALPEYVYSNPGFSSLARMCGARLNRGYESERQRRKATCREFAIDALPEPPALLSKEYSMQRL